LYWRKGGLAMGCYDSREAIALVSQWGQDGGFSESNLGRGPFRGLTVETRVWGKIRGLE